MTAATSDKSRDDAARKLCLIVNLFSYELRRPSNCYKQINARVIFQCHGPNIEIAGEV
jgi:hypothetical protein